jgi:ClpA/ClpB-like protein
MFERFGDRARQVVVLAQEEARRLGHHYVGTEHILVGLLRNREGLAADVLESFELGVDEVRERIVHIVGRGDEDVSPGELPLTPRAKKVLQLSAKSARALGQDSVGTEHVLLGLASLDEGVAHEILDWFGAEAETVRGRTLDAISDARLPLALASPATRGAESTRVRTGAELRVTGTARERAVVCVDGGTRGDVPGTWSASLEWLVRRLAPRFPELAFGEVKYRIKSWNRLGMCTEDALAAIDAVDGAQTLLIGFSMGGAAAIKAARHPTVSTVVGLAPWIPDRLDLSTLDGRRLAVYHGALDRYFPGIPGVNPSNSRRGFERARARGVDASYSLVPGAVHGIAVRPPWGSPVALPKARRWAELVAAELQAWSA